MATSLGLLRKLWQFNNLHACLYKSWNVSEDWFSSCCDIRRYRPISAESQHNFHFLPHFNSKTTEPIFTIFTRCRAISRAINPCINMTIVHPVLNERVLNEGHFPNFTQNWLPWQRPLRYQKRGPNRLPYLHPERFHSVKRLRKSVQRILNAIMPNEQVSYNFGTLFIFYPAITEELLNRFSPFFSRFIAIVELLMRASARRYCILFQNTKAKSEDGQFWRWQKSPKINWLP